MFGALFNEVSPILPQCPSSCFCPPLSSSNILQRECVCDADSDHVVLGSLGIFFPAVAANHTMWNFAVVKKGGGERERERDSQRGGVGRGGKSGTRMLMLTDEEKEAGREAGGGGGV